ncbi:hypothetical protein EBX31_07750 [bacterium]|nr:hypothetical protein [bacterium]
MVVVVVLGTTGEIREGKLVGASPTPTTVAKVLQKTKQPSVIGSWDWSDLRVSVWGWREAAKGSAENKHDLPSPCDEETLYGDAVVVATALEDGTLQDLHEDRWLAFLEDMAATTGGDSESESESEAEAEADAAEVDSAESESDADEEEEEEEAEGDGDEEAEEEEEEEEADDDDCCDEGDDGGGKRRAPRRRTVAAPEYRRLEMGLRSRIRLPAPVGKRAPRWQTAPELTPEDY